MRAPFILIIAGLLALSLQLWTLQLPDPVDPAAPRARVHTTSSATAVLEGALRTPYPVQTLRSPFDLAAVGGASPDAATASETFSLAGLIRAGGTASAVIRDPSGASHVLRPGDSLQGWTLAGVGRDDVTLSRGVEHRTFSLNGPPAALNRTPS